MSLSLLRGRIATYVLIGVAVVAIFIGIVFYENRKAKLSVKPNSDVFCTMEAKQCPDGSYVSRVPPTCEFAACPSGLDMSQWKSGTDVSKKFTFKYPASFGTEYMSAREWPPRVSVGSGPMRCEETTSTSTTRIIRANVNNREYCVRLVNEGAAGSVYTNYTYTAEANSKLASFSFVVQYPECVNYDEPKRTACQSERMLFNLNQLVDQMAQSLTSTKE